MLYSIDDPDTPITKVPHRRDYDVWKHRLSPPKLAKIIRKLNTMIDGDEVHTSSWMPGRNWIGTAFQPIWEKACLKNDEAAAKCFGLILWEVMMEHPEDWSFRKF